MMTKNKKIIMILIICIVSVLVVGIVGTYAWYYWATDDDQITQIFTDVGAAYVLFDAGSNMSGQSLKPVSDKALGVSKVITVSTSEEAKTSITFNLYMDITLLEEGLNHESFKYELYNNDNNLVASGNFSDEFLTDDILVDCEKNNTKHVQLLKDEIISTTESRYVLYLWIDGENYINPPEMQNKNFSINLHADGQNALVQDVIYPDITEVQEGTFAHQIVNTYINSEKTIVNSGDTRYVRYHYDEANNLMADVDGNVRYYGANPNNYIYFNCSDYSNQNDTTCEKWRIVGIVDGKVKIVKNGQLGVYSFDYTSSGTYKNDWNTATLNTLLNEAYYNSSSLTYYNNSTAGSEISFVSNGITAATRDNNIISASNWYINGATEEKIYVFPRDIYISERTGSHMWYGNIALLYPSDYGYAVDINNCKYNISKYNNCNSYNWMYNIVTNFGNKEGWLLLSRAEGYRLEFYVHSNGYVGSSYIYPARGVTPTLYLNPELAVDSEGVGTESNPYRLVIN